MQQSGNVRQAVPVCALLLANGRHGFSCRAASTCELHVLLTACPAGGSPENHQVRICRRFCVLADAVLTQVAAVSIRTRVQTRTGFTDNGGESASGIRP